MVFYFEFRGQCFADWPNFRRLSHISLILLIFPLFQLERKDTDVVEVLATLSMSWTAVPSLYPDVVMQSSPDTCTNVSRSYSQMLGGNYASKGCDYYDSDIPDYQDEILPSCR